MAAGTIKQVAGPVAAAGEREIIHGAITMPRVGIWQASLWVNTSSAMSGRVTIVAGALTLSGTVYRAAVGQGILRMVVVGGGDGMRKLARPKHYTSPPARLVLSDLASDAGETVSATGDAELLGRTLLAWSTLGLETGAMVRALVEVLGADAVWRMLPDGSLWVGRESWPDSGLGLKDFVEVEQNPEAGYILYGFDMPRLLPGTLLGAVKADTVQHVIGPGECRAKVWLAR